MNCGDYLAFYTCIKINFNEYFTSRTLVEKGETSKTSEDIDIKILHPIKNIFTKDEISKIKENIVSNDKVVVIDIETTGFNKTLDNILEIGIVELDINSGKIRILFNSLVREKNFNKS